jgi:hypothetical protein
MSLRVAFLQPLAEILKRPHGPQASIHLNDKPELVPAQSGADEVLCGDYIELFQC